MSLPEGYAVERISLEGIAILSSRKLNVNRIILDILQDCTQAPMILFPGEQEYKIERPDGKLHSGYYISFKKGRLPYIKELQNNNVCSEVVMEPNNPVPLFSKINGVDVLLEILLMRHPYGRIFDFPRSDDIRRRLRLMRFRDY